MDNVNVLRSGFYAIDFTLTDTLGNIFHLKDNLEGRFTCLVFFPNGDSDKINNYLKNLNQGLPATASGLPSTIIAIGSDKVGNLKHLKDKLRLDFLILSDPTLFISNKYYMVNTFCEKPSVYFSVFVVDDTGVIRFRASEVPGYSRFVPEELRAAISRLI